MINVNHIVKTIDQREILKDITFNVNEGSITGLIGDNGAGKTTLIKHMVGAYKATTGDVVIDGSNIYEDTIMKSNIMYIPDKFTLLFGDTLKDNYEVYKSLYDFDDIRYHQLLITFGLKENDKLSKYSKGMQKQAMFILALCTSAKYYIMDEPFDGLDPKAKRLVWNCLVDDVTERNATILISSHHIEELDNMCDHIVLLHEGKVVFDKDLDNLKTDFHMLQIVADEEELQKVNNLHVLKHTTLGKIHNFEVEASEEEIQNLEDNMNTVIFERNDMSLEDIFLYSIEGDLYE